MIEIPEWVLPNGEMHLYNPVRRITKTNWNYGTREVFVNIELTNEEKDAIKFLMGIPINAD